MTLIPLRQPIRAPAASGRPALSTCYPTNMCRGLLPSPINAARTEGGGGGGGIRGKNNSTNYHRRGAGGNNGIYDERQRPEVHLQTLLPAPPPPGAQIREHMSTNELRINTPVCGRHPGMKVRGGGLRCWEIPRAAHSHRQTLACLLED